MTDRIGVGLVGVQPGRSWASVAHIPAIRAMPDAFEIVGLANTSRESGEKAAAASGIRRAFADVDALVAAPEVQLVAVCVKVPHHGAIIRKAFAAGKDVVCEWPIGNGLAEMRELMALSGGVRAFAGTQARVAPAIRYVRHLVKTGYVGEVLSTTLIGSGMNWGPMIEQHNAYTLDVENGATMLTIPFGHTISAIADVLGGVATVSSVLATRRKTVRNVDTNEDLPITSPDQVVIAGTLDSGAPISVHYRGGMPRGTGLLWEINGTHGDLQVTAAGGHAQFMDLSVAGATGSDRICAALAIPDEFCAPFELDKYATNVALLYQMIAADLANGTSTAPTFAEAVRTHQLIAAIEEANRQGCMIKVSSV